VDIFRREVVVGVVVIVQGEADLVEVVAALHAGRGFANLLHRGQQKPDQDADDGDDDEQLDQGEREPPAPLGDERSHDYAPFREKVNR
jgi:hypothetical protein